MEAVFVGAVAKTILTKLSSIALEKINLASSVKQDLDNLKSNVQFISACLRNAENEPVSKDDPIAIWIRKMKSALYDADDLLEEFNYEILSQQRKPENFIKKTVNKLSTSNSIKNIISKKADKINDINATLDLAVKQGHFLKLTQGLLHLDVGGESSQQQDYGKYGDVSKILGRDGDKSKVIDMLLQSSGDLSVVAIIGLGGLGKTTLAKLIFEDTHNIKFDKRIRVCVSTNFNVTTILKQMAIDLGIRGEEMINTKALIESLKVELIKKKYLLILDNVWNTSSRKWDDLTNCLFEIGADKESRILVTTRSKEVALRMHCFSIFQLEGLSEDDSWSLFGKKAFLNEGAKETVTDIGKKIIKRCMGVPLVILTLGALLNTKHENEWISIGNSDLWDLTTKESDIMYVLRLSYDHFPPSLKPCFAYCSIFPKDYIFGKDDLIQLWIAQGLIPESKSMLEDTGNNYFNILVWNSFFQDVKIDYSGNKTCKMHDLVHDLAKSITESESLVLDTDNVNNSLNVRHLHLLETKGAIPKFSNGHKLRTLFLACEMRQKDSPKLEFLRVLNFEKAYKMKELPQSIGKLKSLRYLNVSNTRIKKFPISILDLYSLQTIRFMGCKYFEDLPERLGSMTTLTHLCFDDYHADKMPYELGRLTSLQTLSIFNVGRENGHMIKELGSLKRLRGELRIKYLERIKDKNEAESANLMMKTNLLKLILEWSTERSDSVNKDEDVLAGLEPPPNLRSLTIEKFDGSNFPRWMLTASVYSVLDSNYVQLERLVEVKFINCKRIPTLGELPSLKFLKIRGMDNLKTIGREFYSSNNNNNNHDTKLVCGGGSSRSFIKLFPLLETLMLVDLNNLVEWNEASTSAAMGAEGGTVEVFPCLTRLNILRCSLLKTAPTHFPFLKTLLYHGVRSGDALSKICSHRELSLTSLQIGNCFSELNHLPKGLLQNNKNLMSIHISACGMLEGITSDDDDVGLQNLRSLQQLNIRLCPKLSHIGSMHGLTSLRSLLLEYCHEIRNLPVGLGSCTSLEKVHVSGCNNLGEAGLMELKSLNSLKDLVIIKFNSELEAFPFNSNTSVLKTSLQTLTLHGWKYVPEQIQHLNALKYLSIRDFKVLEALPDWLGNLSSLQSLTIMDCPKLSHVGSMHGLISLIKLVIHRCNLKNLPIGLGSCTSLETLDVSRCKNLISFVEEEDLREMKSLSNLSINNCGKLKGDLPLKGSLNCFQGLSIGALNEELESFPFNFNMAVLQTSLKSLVLYGWPKLKSLPQQVKHFASLKSLSISRFS